MWILFIIKLFFNLRFSQFLKYFKGLTHEWDENYERPLKKFHVIIENEWSKLLKDYSVALHDDAEVLKTMKKVCKDSSSEVCKSTRDKYIATIRSLNDQSWWKKQPNGSFRMAFGKTWEHVVV